MSNVNKFVTEEDVGFVTPEMFGAVGDGVTDDTDAFVDMFASVNRKEHLSISISEKTYIIKTHITVQNVDFLNIECKGKIQYGDFTTQATYVYAMFSFINCNNLKLNGLNIDGNGYCISGINLEYSKDAIISNCIVKNFGEKDYLTGVYGIRISKSSDRCNITNTNIQSIYSGSQSTGIWIYYGWQVENTEIPRNVKVNLCTIEDIYPIEDGDGINVNSNYLKEQINLIVSNCTFRNCRKRALKFKARGCHSLNNVIEFDEYGYCPIDFQMGYNTSNNDIVISNYEGDEDHTSYFYSVFQLVGSYNVVENLGYFITTDPSWMYSEEVGNGSLFTFTSSGDVVKFNDDNTYIIDESQSISEYNIIKHIYGNGVVRHMWKMCRIVGDYTEEQKQIISSAGLTFYLRNNTINDLAINLGTYYGTSDTDRYLYNIKTSATNNTITEMKLTLMYDEPNSNYFHLYDMPTAQSYGTIFLNNKIEFTFFKDENINRNILLNLPSVLYSHSNNVSYRSNNFASPTYAFETVDADGIAYYSNNTRIRFYLGEVARGTNPADCPDYITKGIQAMAKIGDEAIGFYPATELNEYGQYKTSYVCIEAPSEAHPNGKWVDKFANEPNQKYRMTFDDATSELTIVIDE